MVQALHNITNSNGANANQDCIDTVDEWQVTESLQDLNGDPDVPYPLIEGRELFRGIEQDNGSVYLGGVNEGQGLDAELEERPDKMDELDEFEPDELLGGLVFSEDEEDMVDPEEKDDW